MLNGHTNYNVAIYCRLSKDDGNLGESSSIETQRQMLTKYVHEQGWNIYDYYIDDGYSGIDFNRPSFKIMIEEIEKGNINLVITKDLSRFGRNYLEAGTFIEMYFPEKGVRYIGLNDGVDSIQKANMDITPFKNILNEMYSRDISKKVKTGIRTRVLQGNYVATSAPYGYLKDPSNKNHLVVNEEVAPIVKRVFGYALQGLGISKIRQILTAEEILRPAAYAQTRGVNFNRYFENNEGNRCTWSNNSVRGILRNPVYAGHIVANRRPQVTFKSKKRPVTKMEDWVIVRNCHEPIIDPDEFELVQQLITSRRYDKPSGYDNVFSGLLKCADCGYAMSTSHANRTPRPEIIDCMGYTCNNYRYQGKKACTQHWVEARHLQEAVLADIRKHARMALDNNDRMVKSILDKLNTTSKSEFNKLSKEYSKLNKRLNDIDNLFAKLYEDRLTESITDRNYKMMLGKYQEEQEQLTSKTVVIKAKLQVSEETQINAKKFTETIKEYSGIIEFTAPMLNKLIDKVTVSEANKINDERIQTITIYYKFVGQIK